MSQEHIQGQDCEIRVSRDGKILAALTSIVSFELSPQTTKVKLDFLGTRAPKFEQAWDGVDFSFETRQKDSSLWTLLDSIAAVAQHRTPGIEFSIGVTIRYLQGEKVRILLRDIAWDPTTVSAAGRTEPVTGRFGGSAGSFSRITGAASL